MEELTFELDENLTGSATFVLKALTSGTEMYVYELLSQPQGSQDVGLVIVKPPIEDAFNVAEILFKELKIQQGFQDVQFSPSIPLPQKSIEVIDVLVKLVELTKPKTDTNEF